MANNITVKASIKVTTNGMVSTSTPHNHIGLLNEAIRIVTYIEGKEKAQNIILEQCGLKAGTSERNPEKEKASQDEQAQEIPD